MRNKIEKIFNEKVHVIPRREMRSLAFHLIYAVDRNDYAISLDDMVERFRIGYKLDISENSPAITIARNAIENRVNLDTKVKPFLKNWKLERLGCCTKLILRIALWELEQKNAIVSIIINEAVELAKCFAEKDAYKFVNGVLDKIWKEKE